MQAAPERASGRPACDEIHAVVVRMDAATVLHASVQPARPAYTQGCPLRDSPHASLRIVFAASDGTYQEDCLQRMEQDKAPKADAFAAALSAEIPRLRRFA